MPKYSAADFEKKTAAQTTVTAKKGGKYSVTDFEKGAKTAAKKTKTVPLGNVADFRKLDEESQKKYAAVQETAKAKTPIDQRLYIGQKNNEKQKSGTMSYIGINLIPAYKEDTALAKIGKGIVNYGIGGPLSVIGNTIATVLDVPLANIARNVSGVVQGKGLQGYDVEYTPSKIIEEAGIKGAGGQVLGMVISPSTYFGGGVISDLSKAGIIGNAARLGTTENLLNVAARNQGAVRAANKAISKTEPIGGELPKADKPTARIYGEQPKGEIPEGMKERGFSRNIRTDIAMPDDIRQMFDEEPLAYKQISNKETLAKAEKIFNQGDEAATAEFYRSISAKEFKPETVPLSKLLAKQAMESGNIEKARQVLSETANRLTEAGQFSQAAKILRESDPETFLMTIGKQIRKLNEQGAKQYGKKWANIDLLPDEITSIQSIPRGNQRAYEEVWEQIGQRIAKDLPSTGMEKFDAWRRMAMLLNPKTHIRNTIGNVIMTGMRKASDTIGAALEKAFVPVGQRTKSFGWSFNKDIVSKVDETWDAVKKDILGESRWEIDNLRALGREKQVFKKGLGTKAAEKFTGKQFERGALQWVNELSLKTLNAEDNIFAKRAFKDALGQYMQANKLTEAMDAAIEYAKRRALEATFKQTNMLSDFIIRAKRARGVGKLVEGAIPFSKTPANIAARAVEYSPIGLAKLLFSKGKTPAEVIETLSKGLTGTAITALGFYLGASGWAKVERSRSEKAEGLMQEMGDQPNSIITPQGSYTFDWAQPFAVPLAMGIAASEALKNRKDGDTIAQAVWDGIMAGGDTVFNMTMLQNIKQIFSGGSISERLAWIPAAYVEQAVPTILGQVARTIDPVRRSTIGGNRFEQELNKIKSRIPGLSQTLEPALSIWGEEQQQGGAIQQFISPGYWKGKSNDTTTNEVARLYSSFKDTDMLPKVAPKSFSYNGIEYHLTPQQLTEFQRKMGQENYKEIGRLISTEEYKRMTDEQKMKSIEKIADDNYEDTKLEIAQEAHKLNPEQFPKAFPSNTPSSLTINKVEYKLTYDQRAELADMIEKTQQQRRAEYERNYPGELDKNPELLKKALAKWRTEAEERYKRKLIESKAVIHSSAK